MSAAPARRAEAVGSPAVVAVVFALAGVGTIASLARIPSIRDQVAATPATLSLALVCVGIGSVSTMPFTGRLVERFSSATVVRAFALLAALAWIGVSLAQNVPALAVALLFGGAGFGVWDVAMNVQGHHVEQARGEVLMPMLHAVFSFGAVAGALFGAGFAALDLPIQVQFPASWGVIFLAILLVTTRFLDDRAMPADDAPTADDGKVAPARRNKITGLELLIGLMVACATLGEGAANDWLALTLVDERGVAEEFGAIALGGFNLTMAIARLIGGKLIARFGRVPVLRVSGVLAATGVSLVCLVDSASTAVLGAGLWGLGMAVVFPSGISAAGEVPGRGSRAIAVASTIGYGGFLLGAPLIGQLTHLIPLDRALLVVAGVSLGIVFLARVARERRGPVEPLDGGPGEEIVRSG